MRLTLTGWQRDSGIACAVLWFSLFTQSAVAAEEVVPFRLTEVGGELSLMRSKNEVEQGVEGFASSRSSLTEDQQELSIQTQSYVYHPSMLKIDLGAGLLLTQREQRAGTGKTETEGELYNLAARLSFLERKPYPFVLYYTRSHPSTQVSGAERYTTENVSYGVSASLKQPVLPFLVDLDAFRQTSQGSGATQVTNTTNDQVRLRALHRLEHDGYVQFNYQNNQYTSESGVVGLPIDRTDTTSEASSLASEAYYGERQQFKFSNLLSYYTQDNLPQQRDFRWSPYLEWKHSGGAKSYYRFDYSDSEINSVKSTARTEVIGAQGGLTDRLTISGELHASDAETVGLRTQLRGASSRLKYTQPLTVGQLMLGFGTSYDLTENNATLDVARQQNERHVYDGVERIQLAHPFVVSVTNVAVERDGVIVYPSVVAGVDYTAEEDGALTYINVVIQPEGTEQKIVLGDTLLVDYQYETGGTVAYSTFQYNYSADLSLFRYYSLYASYSDTERKLEEGDPTIPLNSWQNTRTGARVDYPFYRDQFRIGGETVYEKQEEEIAPYVRRTTSSFFQVSLTSATSVRLSIRRVRQDNLRTVNDVHMDTRSIVLTTRPWQGSILRLEHSNAEDTGGTQLRRIDRDLVRFQWSVRQLSVSLDGISTDEQQGNVSRQSYSVSARLTRFF